MKRLLFAALTAVLLVGCGSDEPKSTYSGNEYLHYKNFVGDYGEYMFDWYLDDDRRMWHGDGRCCYSGTPKESTEQVRYNAYFGYDTDSTFTIYEDVKHKSILHKGIYRKYPADNERHYQSYIIIDGKEDEVFNY